MVESISKAHADYKLVMPTIVSYSELVIIKKKLTIVEFDAKKITAQEIVEKQAELLKLINSCTSEVTHSLYVSQMTTMVEEIKKAQPNAKIEMPELISYAELQEVIKSVHIVKYDIEKITEKQTLEKKTELIALITGSKNETVY